MPPRSQPRRPAPRRSATARGRLASYHAKRDLAASGEPAGGEGTPPSQAVRRFVIQQHDATRLHFDFRLEMDGVFRSWAVPKGLPEKPGDRALAVEVEDHPLEYGSFEGVIPSGNYGAGTVMLWDRGHYTVSGVPAETAYRQGKMHLALAGEKAVGEWTLVRLRARPGDKHANWLLLKNHAPAHRAPILGAARERSVLSGRTLEEIAEGRATRRARTRAPATRAQRGEAADVPRKKRARAASSRVLAPAAFVPPMKALSVDEIPAGRWRLEIKFDGFRALALLNEGRIELWSRNHKPLTADYPEVVEALRGIQCANACIDGEVVALDAQGRSRFQLLQNRDAGARPPIVFYVFDLLHHDGRSLLHLPLEERQMALEVLVGKGAAALRFSPVFEMKPEQLLAEVRRQGLEGIIAKQAGSAYEPDRRTGAWLKCKVHGEQEFVIGGFTPPKNSRTHFGALLVGYYEDGTLRFAGKVGSGFDAATLASLHRAMRKRRVRRCPFADLPAARHSRFGTGMTAVVMKQVTWVRPELVAQIQFTEWTEDGSLRHPVFLGLRPDKDASEVVREAPRPGA
ncbi:non-homologous end-joining DNA ligase [Opitutus sp. ER46]|uniref:non-homologous end-joining DNA ligase n=1 Tax=Opitutus sp. ER46 TaxID=2161864 RepID=UPI001304EBA6|nr:non-homologous end-joining DNA ligase [Opitutus sp. ER46]